MRIPAKGIGKGELYERLEEYRSGDMPWRDGRVWAYVYDPGKDAEEVIKHAYMSYLSENALDPTVFPSSLRFETELVAMGAAHLNGDENVVGNFTSGGTESIMLAVKAARDWARANRPDVTEPEILLPVTAHAAFQKAAHYLSLKPVLVPVDPETFRADPDAVRRAVTKSTILMVGSAVSYAHGVVDPIGELGQVALDNGLLFHVDGCMGGFLLPYFRRLGAPVPDFDFSVPGVTSMSMDFHKYAFAAKGASVVLYRDKELRKYQIYTCAQWTGYTVINPTVQSTKSMGPLAAAWSILNYFGDEGYMEIARQILDATRRIATAIERHPDLRLLGQPDMNLVAFTSDTVSIFHVIDEMKQRHWYVQPQLGFHGSKENIHLSINPASVRLVDDMIADLEVCVEKAKTMPPEVSDSLKQALSSIDPGSFSADTLTQMLGMAGIQGTDLPDRMAGINEILNSMPAELSEKLLTEFLNELMVYRDT